MFTGLWLLTKPFLKTFGIQYYPFFLFVSINTGRAFEVRLQSGNSGYLNELMKLAITAGFDWVHYEATDHIHISVVPDGKCDYISFQRSSDIHLTSKRR